MSGKEFAQLQQKYPNMPSYPQQDGSFKLAAGWLIDQAGLKGFRHKGVGVHKQQALVLVNYDSDFGEDIISLAKFIQQKVAEKFSVFIMPEVRMITRHGEQAFAALKDNSPISHCIDDNDVTRGNDND